MSFPIIYNNKDLRLAYKMKYFIEQQNNSFQYESFVMDIKKKIRDYNKRENKRIEQKKMDYIVYSGNETCIQVNVVNRLFTESEKQEIIDNEWISINSPYDCTGKLFTQYIHIAEIKLLNKTIIIHSLGLDV